MAVALAMLAGLSGAAGAAGETAQTIAAYGWDAVEEQLVTELDEAGLWFLDRWMKQQTVQETVRALRQEHPEAAVDTEPLRQLLRTRAREMDREQLRQSLQGLGRALAGGADPEQVRALVQAANRNRIEARVMAQIAGGLGELSRSQDRERLRTATRLAVQAAENGEAAGALGELFGAQGSGQEIAALVDQLHEQGVQGRDLAAAILELAGSESGRQQREANSAGLGAGTPPEAGSGPGAGGGPNGGGPGGPSGSGGSDSPGGASGGTGGTGGAGGTGGTGGTGGPSSGPGSKGGGN